MDIPPQAYGTLPGYSEGPSERLQRVDPQRVDPRGAERVQRVDPLRHHRSGGPRRLGPLRLGGPGRGACSTSAHAVTEDRCRALLLRSVNAVCYHRSILISP